MKKIYSLMLLASILCISPLFAQHTPDPVEPGCKGPLPKVAAVPQGNVDYLPILFLERVYTYITHFNGTYYEPTIDCKFPEAKTFGGEYFELQYLKNGNWVNTYYENDDPRQLTYNNFSVRMYPEVSAYRIKLVGGPKDGMLSNIVECTPPRIMTSYGCGYSDPNYPNRVGFTIDAPYVREVKVDSKEIADYAQYVRYNWYRRNPYTFEMTLIEGANESTYTCKLEDVGYDIIGEICGDGKNLDFLYRKEVKNICHTLTCSTEYSHTDGVILNTDYILPDPQILKLGNTVYSDNTNKWVEFANQSVKEIKPGQYIIKADINDTFFNIAAEGNILPLFGFTMQWGEEKEVMMREAFVALEQDYCTLVVREDDQDVETAIDIIRINIDGKAIVDTTYISEKKETVINRYRGKYFVRAHATDNTVATYFPSATRWDNAQAISIPCRNQETWEDNLLVLNLQNKPAAMTGQGVIEGKLTKQKAAASPRRAMSQGADTQEEINVLLYDNKGNLVATTPVAADGTYRFEKVPYGTYSVVVDVAGYAVESSTNVTLSAELPTVTGIDYSMTIDGKIVSSTTNGIFTLSNTSASSLYDLQGRRINGNATQGLYIKNGRKCIMK